MPRNSDFVQAKSAEDRLKFILDQTALFSFFVKGNKDGTPAKPYVITADSMIPS